MYKKIRDFSVGQEVYTVNHIKFGWNQLYKHGIYERHTIKAISPKGRSLTLDDGTKVTVNSYGKTDIDLYKYDPEMGNDTEKAKAFAEFMKTKADFNELYNRSNFVETVARLDADKVPELTRLFQEIVELINGDKERTKE
jgi:hypothetical protein